MHHSSLRREEARRLNQALDRALEHADATAVAELLRLAAAQEARTLAERIARRATALAHNHVHRRAAIIAARNRLVLEVYAQRTPKGWFSAWCDGSSAPTVHGPQAGIGVVLMDAQHAVVAEISQPAGELIPLEAAVGAAFAHGAEQLRVHTDCTALVLLWRSRRDDERLAVLRAKAQGLRHLQLYLVPREHNQLADRLAQRGRMMTQNHGDRGNDET